MPVGKFLLTTLVSFFCAIIFVFFFRKFSLSSKILNPKGTPLVGGVGIWLSFTATCLVAFFFYYGMLPQEVKGMIFASSAMLIFGLLDDCRELSIIAKFLVQIIATTVLVIFGIRTQIVYIGAPMNILITFIWVIGITNAFNHLDVMDAVAAATAMIVSLAFLVISILNNDLKTALFSLVLFGAVSGFMIFNFPPAKVYMGNSGSHFVGFVLAAMTLVISYAPMERKIALFSPLLILGLPIFDTLFVILMRISKRQLPFRKSADHLPLRFLALGYSKKQSLLFMCLLGVIFALFGIALSRVANLLGLIIIVAAFCLSTVITLRMSKVS